MTGKIEITFTERDGGTAVSSSVELQGMCGVTSNLLAVQALAGALNIGMDEIAALAMAARFAGFHPENGSAVSIVIPQKGGDLK